MSSYATTATSTSATTAHVIVRLVVVVLLLRDTEQLVVETVVVAATSLVQQYVESVLEDTRLGEFDFRVFTVCCVNDGRTTYLGNLYVFE